MKIPAFCRVFSSFLLLSFLGMFMAYSNGVEKSLKSMLIPRIFIFFFYTKFFPICFSGLLHHDEKKKCFLHCIAIDLALVWLGNSIWENIFKARLFTFISLILLYIPYANQIGRPKNYKKKISSSKHFYNFRLSVNHEFLKKKSFHHRKKRKMKNTSLLSRYS